MASPSTWSDLFADDDEYIYDGQPAVNQQIGLAIHEQDLPSIKHTLTRFLGESLQSNRRNDVFVLCTVSLATSLGIAEEVLARHDVLEVRACIERARTRRSRLGDRVESILNQEWGGWNVCDISQECSAKLMCSLAKLCRLGVSKEVAKNKLQAAIHTRRTGKKRGTSKTPHLQTNDVELVLKATKTEMRSKSGFAVDSGVGSERTTTRTVRVRRGQKNILEVKRARTQSPEIGQTDGSALAREPVHDLYSSNPIPHDDDPAPAFSGPDSLADPIGSPQHLKTPSTPRSGCDTLASTPATERSSLKRKLGGGMQSNAGHKKLKGKDAASGPKHPHEAPSPGPPARGKEPLPSLLKRTGDDTLSIEACTRPESSSDESETTQPLRMHEEPQGNTTAAATTDTANKGKKRIHGNMDRSIITEGTSHSQADSGDATRQTKGENQSAEVSGPDCPQVQEEGPSVAAEEELCAGDSGGKPPLLICLEEHSIEVGRGHLSTGREDETLGLGSPEASCSPSRASSQPYQPPELAQPQHHSADTPSRPILLPVDDSEAWNNFALPLPRSGSPSVSLQQGSPRACTDTSLRGEGQGSPLSPQQTPALERSSPVSLNVGSGEVHGLPHHTPTSAIDAPSAGPASLDIARPRRHQDDVNQSKRASDKEFDCLRPGRWITGTVMDYCVSFISACNYEAVQVYSNTVLDFEDVIPPKLRSDTERILIPVYSSKHWALAEYNLKLREITVYDSLPATDENRSGSHMKPLVLVRKLENKASGRSSSPVISDTVDIWEPADWQIKPVSVPLQANGDDCGVHTIASLLYRAANYPLPQFLVCHLWRYVLTAIFTKEALRVPLILGGGKDIHTSAAPGLTDGILVSHYAFWLPPRGPDCT